MMNKLFIASVAILVGSLATFALMITLGGPSGTTAVADNSIAGDSCKDLPDHAALTAELESVVAGGANGGLGNDMWATIISRDGEVCAVTFSGENRGGQWPGSRVISAQKANTANAFSLPGDSLGFAAPLSTAQLWSAVQPGGSLFGLQDSNPVDTGVAYKGPGKNHGQQNDPMVGKNLGGVNVFGGGLALYDEDAGLLGAIGVSGDTSCSDHFIAWKVRNGLGLDFVPGGVSPDGDDNIIFDPADDLQEAFAHPHCLFPDDEDDVLAALPPTS